MASLFPSFSSILPAELKSRLGIGPKPVKKPDDPAQEDHENYENRANNTSIYNGSGCSLGKTSLNHSRLPTALQADVRSPGFTSRLTNLVRDAEDDANSVRYSRVGSLPTVNLRRRQQPRLTVRNSTKLRTGTSSVTVKIAPAEPFSPFKSRYGAASSVGRRSRGSGEVSEKSTDPRSVIAVLAELSGKRSRRPSDDPSDVSEEESKRARRDSSSSLGSSLSMEMPPLFSNGVVGQTTSHLVSRETDLSLGSLLSRNQTLFGGSGPHSLAGALNNHTPTVAHATSQTNHGPNRSRCVSSEILASLSSSRCMLRKRGRDLSEDDEDDDDFETPKPKRPNVYRSPDAHLKRAKKSSSRQSSRKSSEAASEDNNTLEAEDESKVSSKSSTPCRDGVVLPSPSELLGTSSRSSSKTPPKECESHAIASQKDIDADRKLQRKRLNKMLAVFSPEDHVDEDGKPATLTEKTDNPHILMCSVSAVESKQANDDKSSQIDKEKQKVGGFPFTLTGPAPPNTPTTAGGFPFDFNKESTICQPKTTKDQDTTTSGFSVNFEAIKSTNVEFSTITSSTKTTASMLSEGSIPSTTVTASSSLPSTIDSAPTAATALGGVVAPGRVVAPGPASALPPYTFGTSTQTDSKLEKTLSTASTTKPPSFGEASKSSTESSAASFNFGLTPSAAASSSTTTSTSSIPTLTFGVTAAATETTTTDSPFKFDASNPKTTTTASVASTFNFGLSSNSTVLSGAATSSAVTNAAPPIFSFGQTTGLTGVTESSTADSPFKFGATKTTGLAVNAVAPTLNLAVTTTTASTPGSTPAVFSFGQASTAASSFGATAPQPGVFTFGGGSTSGPALSSNEAKPAFQFGQSSAASSFNFGVTATTTAATPASTASFGGFGVAAVTTTAPSSGFGGFGNPSEVKPSFGFGAVSVTSSNPFGGFQAPATTTVASSSFGPTPVTKAASSSGLFNFGAKPPSDGTAAAFTFGGKTTAPATTQVPTFSFDKAAPAASTKPFAFGSSAAAGAAPSGVFQFGQAPAPSAAPAPNTGFNFGVAAQSPPSNVFNFNPAASNPAPGSNPFSATVPPSNPAPSNPFSPSGGGAAPVTNPFGAPQNTATPFGGFGTSPSATGGFVAQAAAPGGFGGFSGPAAGPPGGMFSIGAGTNTPSRTSTTRRYATARRRDRK